MTPSLTELFRLLIMAELRPYDLMSLEPARWDDESCIGHQSIVAVERTNIINWERLRPSWGAVDIKILDTKKRVDHLIYPFLCFEKAYYLRV